MKPVYHDATRREIELFLQNPAHAVAIIGERGAGKRHIAERIAAELLSVPIDRLSFEPHLIVVEPDENGTIGIEQARDMASRLQLKTTGTEPIRRIVLIDGAEALTHEAQNALLKVIEEPPADTVIISTISDKTTVLPTVLSRMQTITMHIPPQSELLKCFIESGYSETEVKSAMKLSGGLPGLTQALLEDANDHPLKAAINEAKLLLGSDAFERLCKVDEISNSKKAADIVQAIGFIADVALQNNTTPNGIKRWAQIQQASYEAAEQLRYNTNAKLVLTNLFLRV